MLNIITIIIVVVVTIILSLNLESFYFTRELSYSEYLGLQSGISWEKTPGDNLKLSHADTSAQDVKAESTDTPQRS